MNELKTEEERERGVKGEMKILGVEKEPKPILVHFFLVSISPKPPPTTTGDDPLSTATIDDHHFLRPPYHPHLPATHPTAAHMPPPHIHTGQDSDERNSSEIRRGRRALSRNHSAIICNHPLVLLLEDDKVDGVLMIWVDCLRMTTTIV
ncbi:hypothetical protein AKJ16_DCAP05753 [Drosera capensis]